MAVNSIIEERPIAAAKAAAGGSLTSHTLNGLQWTYAATALMAILQIAVTAVMSRLLTPGEYGIIAAAGLFMRFGSYFSEMGVGQALVQKASISEVDKRAAFTATALIGVAAAGMMWAAAPLSRRLLNDPAIVGVVRLLALGLLLNTLTSTSLNLLRRNLRFRALSLVNTLSFIFSSLAIGVPVALAGGGVWALTATLVCRPLATLVMAYYAERHSVLPTFDRASHKALLSYGTKVSLTSFAEYVFFMADVTVIGKRWGAALLGVYNRSGLVANLLVQNCSTALMEVLFPAFARAQENKDRLATAYLHGLTVLSLVTMPLAIGMIPAARDIVRVVLGPQYGEAMAMVQILALAVPVSMIASYAATLCNSAAATGERLIQQILLCGLMWGGVWLAATRGPIAVAVMSVIVQAFRMAAFQYLAQRRLRIGWSQSGASVLPGLRLAAMVGGAVYGSSLLLPHAPAAARLIAEVAAASVVCLSFSIWFMPAQLSPLVLRLLNSFSRPERELLPVRWYRGRLAGAAAGSTHA